MIIFYMYGTCNLFNLFQENFVLLWSLGLFLGVKKIRNIGRSQLRIKQSIEQLLHKHSDPVVSLLLRHFGWIVLKGKLVIISCIFLTLLWKL